jgi:hypothetical protein
MPLDVEFAHPARFKVRASGEITLMEIERAITNIVTHPGLRGADVLVDAHHVNGVPSTPELRAVARNMVPLLNCGLGAVGVASNNEMIYGVARMFGVFAETVGAKVGAFRDIDDASRWLAERRDEVSAPGT